MKAANDPHSEDRLSASGWPVHPPELGLLEMPPRLTVPIGYRASPGSTAHTEVGSLVAKGEQLCEPSAARPAVLAPTSGRIVGSGAATLLNGRKVPAIEIESDFQDRPLPGAIHDALHAHEQHEHLEEFAGACPEHITHWVERLLSAGVWAERPGSPDLLSQLQRASTQPVDTILCNLLDDEPTMRLNGVLAARFGPILLAGVRLLAKLTAAKRVCIVVEAGSPGRWWTPLRRLARKAKVEFTAIRNDYPQADATLLLLAMLGRRLKPGRSPIEQKTLMLDAAAAIAVGRCARRDRAMLQVPIAIHDHLIRRTHFRIAPVGMSVRQALDQCKIQSDDITLRRGAVLRENEIFPEAILAGGELTIHVMPRQPVPILPDPCIRCSWCAESCPTRVQPAGLLEAAQKGDLTLARHYGLESCIECGVCSYVCPSRLPLLTGIRSLIEKARV